MKEKELTFVILGALMFLLVVGGLVVGIWFLFNTLNSVFGITEGKEPAAQVVHFNLDGAKQVLGL